MAIKATGNRINAPIAGYAANRTIHYSARKDCTAVIGQIKYMNLIKLD